MAALALSACGDDKGVSTQPSGLWGRAFLSSEVSRELVTGTRIRLEFFDGEVRAYAGCNHLMGTAEIDGDRLVVTNVGGTEMGCDPDRHAQDEWLATFLQGQPKWTLDGTTLTLDDMTDTIVLVDREVADPDRPLEGTRWVVDGIVDGDSVSSVPGAPEVEAWLRFDSGRAEGHDGCNSFSGSIEIADASIVFGQIISTDIACEGAKAIVADGLREVLAGTIEFEIDARQLRLTTDSGTGLILLADE